jgi:hypothetical protein
MKTKSFGVGLAIAALASISGTASAQLYAASGSNGVQGHLYIINQANGSMVSDIGALRDATGAPYGMTGMAFLGGVLYGATANSSPTNPGFLVTINTTNAMVTPVGTFSGAMSDLTTRSGVLLGWHSAGDHSMYSINTATGAATIVGGGSGNPGFGGGGLAANAAGTIYSSPNATSANSGFTLGSFYTVNPTTGALTSVGVHTGLSGVLNSMQFVGSTLYAINGNQGAPSATNLVTVNTATGAVTTLGASINDLDSLAYNPVPEPASMVALGIGALALVRRRRKSA